jgi:hypothetical protein
VVLYRLQTKKKLLGYLLVTVALGDEGEDLFFAVGEFREGARWRGRVGGGKVVYEASSDTWTEDGLPAATYLSSFTTLASL